MFWKILRASPNKNYLELSTETGPSGQYPLVRSATATPHQFGTAWGSGRKRALFGGAQRADAQRNEAT